MKSLIPVDHFYKTNKNVITLTIFSIPDSLCVPGNNFYFNSVQFYRKYQLEKQKRIS